MVNEHFSAPEGIADLYSLFAWVMPKSGRHYFDDHGLNEAFIQDMNITLDLYLMYSKSCVSIWFDKGYNRLWYKDIHKYE